jgi:hypothetical protein
MSATMKSEYASNYTRHSRATSAYSFSTASRPSKVTRESIVNPNRIPQPDTFKELIEGEYTKQHIERQQERDRLEFVKHMLFGRKRTFKNFIDNNSN